MNPFSDTYTSDSGEEKKLCTLYVSCVHHLRHGGHLSGNVDYTVKIPSQIVDRRVVR